MTGGNSETVGLILGKFAPLHRGHQLLIETALAEVGHVIVVIYDSPKATPIPLTVRAQWIRRLHPRVEVIEGWGGPPDTGLTREIMDIQESYILKLLGGRSVTHFYSSEAYGEHMSRALGAVNRIVDEARCRVPVSATRIREDAFRHREFLSPVVYRDLIVNIVFVGAPSSGKTTISQRLASEYQTVWMPEYGREYWMEHQVDRRLTLDQLAEIAEGHISREDDMLLKANRILFTDTNAITTFVFSLSYHGCASERLTRLAEAGEKRYDLVFLCDIDIPYDDTWDRSGEVERRNFQQQIIADLKVRRIPYILLSGTIDERCATVRSVVDVYKKYDNIPALLGRARALHMTIQ